MRWLSFFRRPKHPFHALATEPAYGMVLVAIHVLVMALAAVPLLFPELDFWRNLSPNGGVRMYVGLVGGVGGAVVLLRWFVPHLWQRDWSVYGALVSKLSLLAVLLVLLRAPSFITAIVLLIASMAIIPTAIVVHADREHAARVALVVFAAVAASIVCFSAEDYFAFQADRLLLATVLAAAALFGVTYWWLGRAPIRARAFDAAVIVFFVVLPFLLAGRWDLYHYGLILGPVQELLHNGRLPFSDLHAYYGTGLTIFLAGWFSMLGVVSAEGLLLLQKFLLSGAYVALYVLCRSLWGDRRLAFLATLATFAFYGAFLGPIAYETPSSGMLRYGWMVVVLLLLTLQGKRPTTGTWIDLLIALVCAIATLWSSDNVLYTVAPVFALLVLGWEWRRLAIVLGAYIGFAVTLTTLVIAPALFAGERIDFSLYSEYQAVHAAGFGGGIIALRDLFWLLPAFVALGFVLRRADRPQDERITLLALWCLATLSYFVWHGHWKVLPAVSFSFVVLAIAAARLLPSTIARIASSAILAVFLSSLYLPAANVLSGRDTVFASMADIALLLPEAPWTRESIRRTRCFADVEALRPYVESGGLALLLDRHDAYNVYVCLGTGNAFNINPNQALEFPTIGDELFDGIRSTPTRYLLIGDNRVPFFPEHEDRLSPIIGSRTMRVIPPEKLDALIDELPLQPIDTFEVYGEPVTIYRRLP